VRERERNAVDAHEKTTKKTSTVATTDNVQKKTIEITERKFSTRQQKTQKQKKRHAGTSYLSDCLRDDGKLKFCIAELICLVRGAVIRFW